jgi:hypothetical protein
MISRGAQIEVGLSTSALYLNPIMYENIYSYNNVYAARRARQGAKIRHAFCSAAESVVRCIVARGCMCIVFALTRNLFAWASCCHSEAPRTPTAKHLFPMSILVANANYRARVLHQFRSTTSMSNANTLCIDLLRGLACFSCELTWEKSYCFVINWTFSIIYNLG